mgnify:CR=1 FL=1
MRGLLMRVRAVQKRAGGGVPGLEGSSGKAHFGEVEVDFAAYTLVRAGVRRLSVAGRSDCDSCRLAAGCPKDA